MVNKKSFHRQLAAVDSYSAAVHDLLDVLMEEQFLQTKKGARDLYKQYHSDEAQCALSWMNEHYDTIEATVRATLLLSGALTDLTSALCTEARNLICGEETT